ncbi:uncharacterized protein PgNI_08617 [Pyricularia grisea]|uniref:Uncharacterized protein n=1 Tax=Pyricularia grisea TaxID=148305 RepID=A0A6P8AWQ3_PYRGI|nr:uncharacterized protein PgNI_08617 [Pyricularia grisea]TLD06617.1 hypothetical protein PgNI_08617 [Pyricularia grisea]
MQGPHVLRIYNLFFALDSAQGGARSAGPFAYILRTRGVREAWSLEYGGLRRARYLVMSGNIASRLFSTTSVLKR